ncbi:hypothetical protein [Flavobacterium pallidum]|nr:hypothetical protein [Flavobacterium pallidum]
MTKSRIISYISVGILLISCSARKVDLSFMPKSLIEFYFPQLSADFVKKQEDCISQKRFPCDFPEPNDSLNDFVNTWYSKHLKSLKEPIIYNSTQNSTETVRFTHLGTWSNPRFYRIEKSPSGLRGYYGKTNGLGGYDAGKRIEYKEKILPDENWNQILNQIKIANFWNIQTQDPNMILDGEEWILEILIDGRYHVVSRNSPGNYGGEEYAKLCNLVMTLVKK